MSLFPLVVLPAGVAVAAAASGGTPNSAPAPQNITAGGNIAVGVGGSAPGATIGDLLQNPPTVGGTPRVKGTRLAMSGLAGQLAQAYDGAPPASAGYYLDPAMQEKLDLIKQYGEAAYNNMDAAARQAAAKEFSEALDIDPPLDGTESWEEIGQVAGATGGVAACAATGLGAPAAPLCAMVGGYLGGKLGDLVARNEDEIKAWFESKWSEIETWVTNQEHKVEDAASDVIDYLGSLF